MAVRVESSEAAVDDAMMMMREAGRRSRLDAAMATQRLVAKDGPTDRGDYRLGWTVRRVGDEAWVVNEAPHAGIIELGARPHWAPIEPILEWAKRKAGDLSHAGVLEISARAFRSDGTYRGSASLDGDDLAGVKAFAYAVQAKIAREGQAPQFVMRNRLPHATELLRRSFESEIRRLNQERGNTRA